MRVPGWWPGWLPPSRWKATDIVADPDLVPNRLGRRSAVLVTRPTGPAWLVLDCPCRTGHRLMLNLSPARRPRWTVTGSNPLTLTPSVDSRQQSARCHFWLRNGRVHWVPEAADDRRG